MKPRQLARIAAPILQSPVGSAVARWAGVPIVAVFFGVIVRMFYREREPPHFHAEHHGQHAKFDFNGCLIVGTITSNTALRQIREWAQLRQAQLELNWEKMKTGEPLDRIAPLE